LALALVSAGNNMLARMAMIAMTTNSSIKVKPNRGQECNPAGFLIRCPMLMVRPVACGMSSCSVSYLP